MDGAAQEAFDQVKHAARSVHQSRGYRWMVRGGLVAFGVVHLLIGYLSVQLAFGRTGEDASQAGALRELASYWLGGVLIGAVAVGFWVISLWQLMTVFLGWRQFDGWQLWTKRGGSLGRVVVYAVLGYQSTQIALGLGTSESGETESSITAAFLSAPLGQLLVGLVGIAIISVGGSQVWKGVADKYRDDLEGELGTTGTWLARVGHVAKGIAIGIIGGLFVWAAIAYDPESAGGMDQALQSLREMPFGQALLLVMSAGLAAYGVYCFFWARRARFR